MVVLGTGTPIPDAFRGGSSIAVVHKGESYLFDVGAGLFAKQLLPVINMTFLLSILHRFVGISFSSPVDHTMDLSELAHTLWWRRQAGLQPGDQLELTA
ncbi:MAG: hypothetical protein CM1200mP40_04720 [Gammaproteobacteria bacterium]|nr:MAG: hypothetical protein CM1200mP40_04720 [Gammaproteobacteria bacterium]